MLKMEVEMRKTAAVSLVAQLHRGSSWFHF